MVLNLGSSKQNWTIKDIADAVGLSDGAIRKRLSRNGFIVSSKESIPKDALEALSSNYEDVRALISTKSREAANNALKFENSDNIQNAKEQTESKPYVYALNKVSKTSWTFLDMINITEISLILFGTYNLLGWTGLVVGVMVVSFFFDTIRTVKNSEAWAASSFGLIVTFIISAGSGFLHYVTFLTLLENSNAVLPLHKTAIATILAVTTSGISFSAILQTRNKVSDEI